MHGKSNTIRKSTNPISILFVVMRAEVDKSLLKTLTVVIIKMGVFLDATPYRLVEKCRHFRDS